MKNTKTQMQFITSINTMIKSLLLLFLLSPIFSIAQEMLAKEGSFGVDHEKNIIVWHVSNIDSILSQKEKPKTIYFGQDFELNTNTTQWSYTQPIIITKNETTYSLYLTSLPVVHISIDTSAINNRKKITGNFTFFNKGKVTKTLMRIRHRGNLSLSFPKKSYDLEFWTDTITKQTKDVKFKAMRSDDDWILDALYNEPLKLRSTIATRLWNKIHQPYYIAKEPKAKSGFDVTNVEVFKNNSYWGVYALSESVDKKQLKLKSHIGNAISGELIKAESYEGSPSFTKAKKYNNLFPHWGGFEMEYPLIDYRAHWNNLAALCTLTVNGNDDEFKNTIANQIHLENTIDYYLFVNILRATDNLGKNYYLAKYEANEPYFFVPWDLDGVLGIIQEGKHISTTNDILGNGLFNRLLEVNPDGYKQKVKSRWKTLRETHFSNSKLFQNINETYTKFDTEKIYDREQMVWPKDTNYVSEYNYLETWLKERLAFLDIHFESL